MKAHLFISVLLLGLSAGTVAQRIAAKPNIILVYADDLGIGELGAYGQEKIRTPHIDRMSREGMRFTDFYTGSPVCAPARCILLTGRHGGHAAIRGNYELGGYTDDKEGGQMPLPEGSFTIAHLLKQAGYATGAIGKWGLGVYGSSGSPDKQGFDYFYGYTDQKQAHNHYPTHLWENGKKDSLANAFIYVHRRLAPSESHPDSFAQFSGTVYAPERMMAKTEDFISRNRQGPFFLYLPYTLPHLSLQAPASAVDAYRGLWADAPYRGEKSYASTLYPRATYAAMISYLDSMVGNLFRILKEQGLLNNTLVLFTSDNGATFDVGGMDPVFFGSNLPYRGAKMDLYEGGVRVPMIAWWKGKITPGSTCREPAIQYDLMSTIAAVAGLSAPENDGQSLVPLLEGKPGFSRGKPYLYFEYPEKGGQVAIRIGKWKGVRTGLKTNVSAPWQLYNLAEDGTESRDLAERYPDIIREFNRIMVREHEHPLIREWEIIDPRWQ